MAAPRYCAFDLELASLVREHLLNQGNHPQLVDANLAKILKMRRELRSTAVREAIAWKKARGLRYNKSAGYGWKWSRSGRRVPDENERRTMAEILALREAGNSWAAIARKLLLSGVRLSGGREWSAARCRRAAAQLESEYRTGRHPRPSVTE
jgi:DNA invertase Pin-like site-specific DNA recombinase